MVALIAGWVTTEVGRQPWVVYEVMRTADAVTGAAASRSATRFLVLVYAGLVAAVVAAAPAARGSRPDRPSRRPRRSR